MALLKVLIADDHTLFREGLRLLLEQSGQFTVVGEASDGQEALEVLSRTSPDIIILDISMPRMDGLEAARRIRARLQKPILFLTVHDTDNYFFDALEAGASGYVLKDAIGADLIAALHVVHRGGIYLSPSVTKRLVEDYLMRVALGEERQSFDTLTPREQEVLQFIAQGLMNREIAERMFLSVNTIQTHRLHIMEKLNLHNRAQLVQFAVRLGLFRASAPGD